MTEDEDLGAFLFAMTRTARRWRRELDILLDHYGLTEARTRPLVYIERLGEGIRQKDLAAELEIEGSSLVRLLDSLEQGKLIKRRMRKDDRRERSLHLTPAGRDLVHQVHELTNNMHLHVLDSLSSADRRTCLAAFQTLYSALEHAADTVDPSPIIREKAGA